MEMKKLWPVYKGGSFNLWQPDTGKYFALADPERVKEHLQRKRQNQANTRSSAFYSADEAWVEDPRTLPSNFPRVAYRDVTRSSDPRTCIVCLVPPKVFLTGNAPYLFCGLENQKWEAFILGVMSSVPFDWYTRRVVEIHFTFTIFNECPFPNPPEDDPLRLRVVEIAGHLAAVDERYAEWAEKVGVPVASANTDPVKSELIAELDAAVALLYGLDENDLRLIWQTFHPTTDHLSELDEVLWHHHNLQSEL